MLSHLHEGQIEAKLICGVSSTDNGYLWETQQIQCWRNGFWSTYNIRVLNLGDGYVSLFFLLELMQTYKYTFCLAIFLCYTSQKKFI